MIDKIGKGILILILTASVLVGGYLGYYRYFIELQDRTVELCVDLNDLRKIAAFEKKPLGPILEEVKKQGIVSIGLFEETLPDAAVAGELFYAKGSGLRRFKDLPRKMFLLVDSCVTKPDRTYIYAPEAMVRKRVYDQLQWLLGKKQIKFYGSEILEVNEAEEEIREIGLGLAGSQAKYLKSLGFNLVPRVRNDPRFHLGNIEAKISAFEDHDTIIFDGEEILGYPDGLTTLASALKKNKIKYGYIEIVKQDGDKQLRRLMGREVLRVHSVSENELKKLKKDEVVDRFVRAARERKVRMIYIRSFLPPQVDAYPVAYNLKYFGEIKTALTNARFVIGRAESPPPLQVVDWQLIVLGLGVVIGGIFLLNYFFKLNIFLMYLLVILAGGGLYFGANSTYSFGLQKVLALLTAIVFPSLAVISSFSRRLKPSIVAFDATLIILNVVAESLIGVLLLIGLMADHRFMLGVETFMGVKLALITPIILVACYFILNQGTGNLKERLSTFLNTQVKLATILLGVFVMGGLMVYLARSGNFVLPVPIFEKYFRNFLETLFFIRPRTKEFLIGYPLLYLAALTLLRDKKQWLWVLAGLGAIAPVSLLNTFSHSHTPLVVSMVRTVNGLVLGVIIGTILVFIVDPFIRKEE
ncbi:MAG: hypothetical protein KJ732_03825 [Candidatus Margulisbacteria bacterium]|nr:hypothetical protein [Candidatus Margulisiibacteriota bacterium]